MRNSPSNPLFSHVPHHKYMFTCVKNPDTDLVMLQLPLFGSTHKKMLHLPHYWLGWPLDSLACCRLSSCVCGEVKGDECLLCIHNFASTLPAQFILILLFSTLSPRLPSHGVSMLPSHLSPCPSLWLILAWKFSSF